jgi:hypothetical protein
MLKAAMYLLVLVALATGCAATVPPPTIKTTYFGTGTPIPRPESAQIEIYRQSVPPARPFRIIGELEVFTERSDLNERALLGCALEEAQKLGGDAFVFEVVKPAFVLIVSKKATALDPFGPSNRQYSPQRLYPMSRPQGKPRLVLKASVIVWE